MEKLKGEKVDVYIASSNILITALNTDDPWRKSKLEGKKLKDTQKEAKPEKPKEAKPKKISKSQIKESKD